MEFWWCLKRWGAEMCSFGVFGLSRSFKKNRESSHDSPSRVACRGLKACNLWPKQVHDTAAMLSASLPLVRTLVRSSIATTQQESQCPCFIMAPKKICTVSLLQHARLVQTPRSVVVELQQAWIVDEFLHVTRDLRVLACPFAQRTSSWSGCRWSSRWTTATLSMCQ